MTFKGFVIIVLTIRANDERTKFLPADCYLGQKYRRIPK